MTEKRTLTPLEEQATETMYCLQSLVEVLGDGRLSRDEMRLLRMAIQRLERGLAGQRGTDIGRTFADYVAPVADATNNVEIAYRDGVHRGAEIAIETLKKQRGRYDLDSDEYTFLSSLVTAMERGLKMADASLEVLDRTPE